MMRNYNKYAIKKKDIQIYGTMIILLLYSFFYQAFFTSAILKYLLFGCAFILAITRVNIKVLNNYCFAWVILIAFMFATSITVDDWPLTLALVFIISSLLMSNDRWTGKLINIVIVFALFHAIITIACWIIPSLRSEVIIPLFFNQYTSRDIIGYQCGFTNHYSTNGMYLGFGVVASGIKYLNNNQSKYNKHKRKDLLSLLIILFALLLTTKRTHLASALVSLILVYIIVSKVKGNVLSASFKIIIIAGIAVSAVIIFSSSVTILGELVSRFAELGDDTTFHGRSYFYAVAISLWIKNPWHGAGWGGFAYSFGLTKLGSEYAAEGYARIQPHNVYLQLLSDLGVIGLALFLFVSVKTIVISVKELRYLYKNRQFDLAWICIQCSLGFQLYYLLCGLTGNPLNDMQLYIPYLISCSAAYAINFQRRRKVVSKVQ